LFYTIWLFPKCLTHCLPPFKGKKLFQAEHWALHYVWLLTLFQK
jgi:hypothetical protein